MQTALRSQKSSFPVLKEVFLSFSILIVLFTMDRCLENLYFFFLYDTGKRYLDVFMSLYLHAHRYLTFLVPAAFVIWLIRNRFRVNYGILLPILFVYAFYLITSLLTSGFTSRWINKLQYPMVMYLFVTMMCSSKKNACRFFRLGIDLYIVLLTLNAAFTAFPQLFTLFTDWTPDYFLSADNLTGYPLFFGALFALLDRHFNQNPIRFAVYLILFLINQILIHCTGSVIAAVVFILYLIIPGIRKYTEQKSLIFFVILSTTLCFLLVTLAYLYFHSDIVYRLLDPLTILKESLYIRFILWNGILLLILKHPLLGYGLGEKAEIFLRPDTSLYYNAHNAWLQTLYEGGALTMLSMIAALGIASWLIRKNKNQSITGIFNIILFADFLMMLSAIPSWFTWYPVLLIAQIAVCTVDLKEI